MAMQPFSAGIGMKSCQGTMFRGLHCRRREEIHLRMDAKCAFLIQ